MMCRVDGGMRTRGTAGTRRGEETPAAGLSATVAAAREGDEEAFRSLYRAVQPGLVRYLTVLVGGDAEDLASETWLQIARDLGSFRGDGDAFRAWSVTIARHRAMDHLRQRRRRPQLDAPVEALLNLSDPEDTASRAIEGLTTEEAIALIRTLPRDQAEAVLLRAVVGLDAQSAARVLGKRAGAVRVAAHRGLRRLAAHLEAAGDPRSVRDRRSPGDQRDVGDQRDMGDLEGASDPRRGSDPRGLGDPIGPVEAVAPAGKDAPTGQVPAPRPAAAPVARPHPGNDAFARQAGSTARQTGGTAPDADATARERGRAR